MILGQQAPLGEPWHQELLFRGEGAKYIEPLLPASQLQHFNGG